MIHDIEGTNVTTGDTDWRAADPPVCPECNTDHSYWPWEMRDQYRATMRENARLAADLAAERAKVARLVHYIRETEDAVTTGLRNGWTCPDDWDWTYVHEYFLQPGDLDDPATTPGTEAEQ